MIVNIMVFLLKQLIIEDLRLKISLSSCSMPAWLGDQKAAVFLVASLIFFY